MLEFLEVMTSFSISINYGAVKASALCVSMLILIIMVIAVIIDVDGHTLDKAIKIVKRIFCIYMAAIIIMHVYAYAINLNDYHEFMMFKRQLHELVEMYK